MKRCTFEALVTASQSPASSNLPGEGETRRMTVRGHDPDTGQPRFFSALVTGNGPAAGRPGDHHLLVTIQTTGDGAPGCLTAGAGFQLWLTGPIGHGTITRRLFWPATA